MGQLHQRRPAGRPGQLLLLLLQPPWCAPLGVPLVGEGPLLLLLPVAVALLRLLLQPPGP